MKSFSRTPDEIVRQWEMLTRRSADEFKRTLSEELTDDGFTSDDAFKMISGLTENEIESMMMEDIGIPNDEWEVD